MRTEPQEHRYKCDACGKQAKGSLVNRAKHENSEHQSCAQTPKGRLRYVYTRHKVTASESEMFDRMNGACIACGSVVEECIEPDAREYKCECCGAAKVYGLEELLIMGLVTLED